MKTFFPSLLLVILHISTSFAQKSPIEFGKIPMEDLTMKAYENDSTAAAVVLVDYGEAYIQTTATASAEMTFERHVRIKILKKEGLQWANAVIPLFKIGTAEEKVTQLKAATFNFDNGKVIESKLSKSAVFKENFNRNYVHHKFTFPDVKVGSVIEYSFKIRSDFLTNFPNWQFQQSIPTRLSEYWAIIPDFFVFEKYVQGYLPISSYEVKPMDVSGLRAQGHHYVSKKVPAFKEEPYMTSDTDYVSKINFALSHIRFPNQPVVEVMGSWAKLNQLLLDEESFRGVVKGSGFLKKTVEEIIAGMTEPDDKINAIHSYVRNHVEWDGTRDFYAGNLRKVLELKKGSAGDINLLMASMLEKAGFGVDMVLLSTRDHGFVREQYPMMRQFNYVVCLVKVGDKPMFLDATEKHLAAGVLPVRCLNGRGLVISHNGHGWVSLDTRTKARTVVSAEIKVENSGDLITKLELTREGYDASKVRKAYHSKGEETYVKDFIGSRTWEVSNSSFSNISDITLPVKENYEVEIPDYASVAGNNIYFSPFVISQIEGNPYKAETRVYPVDYGSAIEQIYFCKITLPEGYVIEEAPKSEVMALPESAARYAYNVTTGPGGDWIIITSSFQVNRNIFLQTEYPNLREFYNRMIAKQAEQIVLRKKL